MPIPSAIGPTGYMSATRLPAQNSEKSGPRTLDTVTLNGGRTLSKSRVPATARAARVASAGTAIWARSPTKRPPCSFSCSLATRVDSLMASSRSTGSSMSLASETSIPEIWLPRSSPSPSGRVETGTMATSGCMTSSSRASSRRRSPPETQARTTSFTVASKLRPTTFTSSSGTDSDAKRLRLDTAPLNDVFGAPKKPGGGCSPRPASSRLCMPRSATASIPSCSVRSVDPGWRASDDAAWRNIWAFEGSGAGFHSGGSGTTRARGVRSMKAASTEAPLTPSRMA